MPGSIRPRRIAGVFALAGFWALSAAADPKPAVTAACSVHLVFPGPRASAFYDEVAVERSARGSFFMACGFQAGHFGLQELGDGKKVVIFSVWDAPDTNADVVDGEKQVAVLYKADGVWVPLDKARFEASEAVNEAREKINAGVLGQGFFLQSGGDTQTTTRVRTLMTRKTCDPPLTDMP